MVSVVVEAGSDEHALAEALAVLVPAVADGFLKEALIADPLARPGIGRIADALGCTLVTAAPRQAYARARCEWVLTLAPGVRLEPDWHFEARAFIDRAQRRPGREIAAAFADAGASGGALAYIRGLSARFARRPGALLAPRDVLATGRKVPIERLRARAYGNP
jgi:hypothetical protein